MKKKKEMRLDTTWLSPIKKRPVCRLLIFKTFNAVDDSLSSSSSCDKKQTILESSQWFGYENKVLFYSKTNFQPVFYPKHLRNTLGILLNQSMTSQNAKNQSKTWNQPGTINLLELIYVFLGILKAKVTQ